MVRPVLRRQLLPPAYLLLSLNLNSKKEEKRLRSDTRPSNSVPVNLSACRELRRALRDFPLSVLSFRPSARIRRITPRPSSPLHFISTAFEQAGVHAHGPEYDTQLRCMFDGSHDSISPSRGSARSRRLFLSPSVPSGWLAG